MTFLAASSNSHVCLTYFNPSSVLNFILLSALFCLLAPLPSLNSFLNLSNFDTHPPLFHFFLLLCFIFFRCLTFRLASLFTFRIFLHSSPPPRSSLSLLSFAFRLKKIPKSPFAAYYYYWSFPYISLSVEPSICICTYIIAVKEKPLRWKKKEKEEKIWLPVAPIKRKVKWVSGSIKSSC